MVKNMQTNCLMLKMISKNNVNGSIKLDGFHRYQHWHSELEYVYVKRGYVEIDVNDALFRLEEGQMMMISSSVMHSYLRTNEKSILYVIKIPIEDLYALKSVLSKDIRQSFSSCILLKKLDSDLIKIYEEIIFSNHKHLNQVYILSKILEFTIKMLSYEKDDIDMFKAKPIESSDITSKIQNYMENSLKGQLTLEMMAEHLGFSTTYCSKIIKEKTNYNFVEYVNQVRLREASELLQTTNLRIIDICYTVGFNSLATFNRNFKKYWSISPKEFRKNLINDYIIIKNE